jgi:ABC-type lipoprotein release transport system permease subunit
MHAPDATVSPGWGEDCFAGRPPPPSLPEEQGALLQLIGNQCLDDVSALPAVATVARISVFAVIEGTTRDGIDVGFDFDTPTAPQLIAAQDGAMGAQVDGRKVLDGRRADPTAVDEVEIGIGLAHLLDIGVGDQFRVVLMDAETQAESAPGEAVDLRVVGVAAAPVELDVAGSDFLAAVHATPAFHARYAPTNFAFPGGFLLLDDDASIDDLQQQVHDAGIPVVMDAGSVVAQHDAAQRATHIEALALWLVAAVVAISGVAFCGQVIARQLAAVAKDNPVLHALGMTRRGLRTEALLEAAAAAALGTGLGAAVAVAASPALPIGLARTVEPDPGLEVDALILVIGAGLTVALCVCTAALVVHRTSRTSNRTSDVRSRHQWLHRVALGPPATQGVRLALEPGRGAESVPVRSGLVGTIAGTTLLVASLVFGASIDHLLATNGLAGWNWDAAVFPNLVGEHEVDLELAFQQQLLADRDVVGVTAAIGGADVVGSAITVDGHPLAVVAVESLRGDVAIAVIDGRAPRSRDEIAFGGDTMDDLDVSIGDEIEVTNTVAIDDEGRTESVQQRMRVVGRAALPSMGEGGGPGRGAAVTFAGMAELATPAQDEVTDEIRPNAYFVDFREGTDADAAAARLRAAAADEDQWRRWARLQPLEADRLRRLPFAVALVVGALALGTLLHVTLATARRRRRELAVLKSMGFVRGQLRVTMWVQASTLAVTTMVIAIPAGLVLGRTAWIFYARALAVVPRVDVPVTVIGLVLTGAALLLANLVATVPATMAARVPAADVLRAE